VRAASVVASPECARADGAHDFQFEERKMKNTQKIFNALTMSVAIAALASAVTASAQTAEHKTLTLQGAEQAIAAARMEAQKEQAPGAVIAVVDDGGNLMALERIDGTFAAGANVSIGKARTAVMFKKPTRVFEELINSNGKGRTVMTALPDFTPLIGGIPIVIDGEIVGGVGVSGAASADQDEKLAIAGANALSASASPAVSYFDQSVVADGFAKGSVLLDGSSGRNYMVHTSRREKPGQAEIHTKDTDIIYVLDGSASVVTGGQSSDAKVTAPDELRGSSIQGGAERHITKGDVLVIPNGVPHQFTQVTNPVLYLAVKVR